MLVTSWSSEVREGYFQDWLFRKCMIRHWWQSPFLLLNILKKNYFYQNINVKKLTVLPQAEMKGKSKIFTCTFLGRRLRKDCRFKRFLLVYTCWEAIFSYLHVPGSYFFLFTCARKLFFSYMHVPGSYFFLIFRDRVSSCNIYAVQQDTHFFMIEFYSSHMLARHVSDLTGPSSGAFVYKLYVHIWYVVISVLPHTKSARTVGKQTLLKMDRWGPKHVELTYVMNKTQS